MVKFRYYITSEIEGAITGTDSTETAEAYAESEDFFVVDTETGHWLQGGGTSYPVEEARQATLEEDEEEDED